MNVHESHGYSVPTYQAPEAGWYHFLHGNVPGHQIDFIYRADVPQGPLTRQHFSHLARLMKYIEPRHGSQQAFAIGNLSRDDTQYEPGHGGIALIFGLRVKGAVDHAGRQDPPFCHAVACVDRQLDTASIHAAATRFHEQLLEQPNAQTDGCRWYQTYVAMAQQSSWAMLDEMQAYVRAFTTIPALGPSNLGLRWTIEGSSAPKRVVIVYPDQSPFSMVAYHMARIASVLVESDIRWTAISTGREQDLMGGMSVRFVSEREVVQEADDVVLMHLSQVPGEAAEIARLLFGAQEVRLSQTPDFRLKWRHMGDSPGSSGPDSAKTRPWAKPEEPLEIEGAVESSDGLSRPHHESEPARKRWRALAPAFWAAGILIFALVIGLVFAATRAPEVRSPNEVAQVRPAAPMQSTPSTESASPPLYLAVQPENPAPSAASSASAAPSAGARSTKEVRQRKTKTRKGSGVLGRDPIPFWN